MDVVLIRIQNSTKQVDYKLQFYLLVGACVAATSLDDDVLFPQHHSISIL